MRASYTTSKLGAAAISYHFLEHTCVVKTRLTGGFFGGLACEGGAEFELVFGRLDDWGKIPADERQTAQCAQNEDQNRGNNEKADGGAEGPA